MRLLVAYFGVLFACGLISQATCMTNREFVDMMKDSAGDVKESSLGDDDYDNKDDGAIELPGGPDDELNLDYLMVQSGLPEMLMSQLASLSKSESKSGDLGYLRHGYYIEGCRCRAKTCRCCRRRRFRVNFWHKILTFTLNSCVRLTYRSYYVLILKFTMNHMTVFHQTMSLKSPFHKCTSFSSGFFNARACVQVYHVYLPFRTFCVRFYGFVSLCARFSVNMHLGCYRVYAMEEDQFRSLLADSESLMAFINSGDPSIETTDYFNLTEPRSLVELVKHAEITEIANHGESMEPADIKETAEDDDAMETP